MTLSLLTTIVLFLFSLKLLPQLKTFQWMSLDASISSQIASNENKIHKGMQGKSITALRPVGKAEIGDVIVEVITQGEFIAVSTLIEVVRSFFKSHYRTTKKIDRCNLRRIYMPFALNFATLFFIIIFIVVFSLSSAFRSLVSGTCFLVYEYPSFN